ncbi:GW domain-containing glycosaminoglycan-binding protein [Ectobacillus polymachus]|uniref:GW domain-containing glycosaminoglycan-binding protein n=1 Tax=Ectobacillus polymachus TaxID=1508806 RepID=UPI003A8958F3
MKKFMVIGSAVLTMGVFATPASFVSAASTDGQLNIMDQSALIGNVQGDGIWTHPYGEQGASYEGDISLHAGTIVHITASIQHGSVTWYAIEVDGNFIGWVDSRALETNIPAVSNVNADQVVVQTNGNGIWSSPYGLQGAKYIGSTNDYVGKDVKIVKQMTNQNVLWSKVSIDGKVIGWVDNHALSSLTDISESNDSAVMDDTEGNAIWTMPYGLPGAQYVDNTNKYAFRDLQVVAKTTNGSTQWYKVMVDGKAIGWIDAKAIDTAGKTTAENKDAVIGSKANGIWSAPFGVNGAQYVGSTLDYALQHIQVKKSVKQGDVTWYEVQLNGQTLGFIDAGNALSDLQVTDENSTETVTTASTGDGIWSLPYGENEAKYVGPTNKINNQTVQVVQSVQKGSTTWKKIKVGDRVIGWVDGHVFKKLENVKDEDRDGVIGSVNDGDGIWSLPYGEDGARYMGPVNNYSFDTMHIIQSATKSGVTWNKIELPDGTTGWIDARIFDNEYNGLDNIKDEDQQGLVTQSNGDAIWSAPYGEHNAKYLGSVDSLRNKYVQIVKQAKKDGTTWYKIKLPNNGFGWVDARVFGSVTYTADTVKQKAYSLGFFDRGNVLVYNKNGQSGNASDDLLYLKPIGKGDTDIQLTAVSPDPSVLSILKDLGATILPTGSQQFYDTLKNNPESQTLQLDGRTIQVNVTGFSKVDIKFGPIVK